MLLLAEMFDLLNIVTGKRHWFSVEMEYRNNNNVLVFSADSTIGVVQKHEIFNSREVKKTFGKTMNSKKVKHLLCNGSMRIKIVSYLGKFKGASTLKESLARFIGDGLLSYIWFTMNRLNS